MEFANRFFAPGTKDTKIETPDGQKVTHSPILPIRNIKPTKVFIHSDMLLQNPFLEWTIATLNSGASTISRLSMKISDLPQETWKTFLNNITLPQLSGFEITSESLAPFQFHGACFAGMHSFLGHHANIEFLHLYGIEDLGCGHLPRSPFLSFLASNASLHIHSMSHGSSTVSCCTRRHLETLLALVYLQNTSRIQPPSIMPCSTTR